MAEEQRAQGVAQLTWAKQLCAGEAPAARGGHTAVLAESQLVVFGGHFYRGDSNFEYLNDTLVLDVGSMAWRTVHCRGEVPEPRYGHSALLVGSRMFVFGGKGAGGRLLRDVRFLDLADWTWTKVRATSAGPTPRFDHAALLVGRKMVVHGGWDGRQRCMDDTWIFDTETSAWMEPKISGMKPSPRHGHSLNLLPDGRIVCLGGKAMDGGVPIYHSDFRQLDPETMRWSKVRCGGPAPSARYGHSAVVVGSRLIVYGGWGAGGIQGRQEGNRRAGADSAVCFDAERAEWYVSDDGGRMPQHLYGHTCSVVDRTMLLFGGWNGHQSVADLVIMEA